MKIVNWVIQSNNQKGGWGRGGFGVSMKESLWAEGREYVNPIIFIKN
jgi:hypothetical protein